MMKKLQHLLLLSIILGICSMAKAGEVTIKLSEQGYDNAEDVSTLTVDGITLTFSKANGSYSPKYYNIGNAVRIYGGNTLTVDADSHDIIQITMVFQKSNSPSNSDFSVDCGSATIGVITTWTGNSNTVVFTNTASTGHWRLQTITVETQVPVLPVTDVTSITALRALEDGTKARLTFGRDNPGKIEYVHEGDVITAYVRDNDMAVSFKDFLPDDAGWHTNSGGALIGSVDGEYNLNNGMPEFTHVSTSIADSILCLDNWEMPAPLLVSNLSDLADVTHRADYVAVENVTIGIDDQGYFMGSEGQTIALDNYFGMSDNIPDDLRGRTFNVAGILDASEDGSCSVLHYTQIDEIVPEIALGETLHTNLATIGSYDDRLVNVTIDRNLVTNTWNTLCLPFDIFCFSDIVSSAKLAEFTGYNAADNSLEFTSVKDLQAGVPYLVFPVEEVDEITVQGANIQSGLSPIIFGTYEMVGIYEPTTLYAGDTSVLFLGNNNTLYYPNVTNELKAFRAYFQTTNTQPANIFVDGVMTNITTATLDGESSDGPIYNIGGQMVSTSKGKLPKGVYVKSGNKMVIR
ncbi:MAG: hypothetical protein IKH88_00430 [Prevotella sp.]|nr:hypothetical protein [Prevotella sp.]